MLGKALGLGRLTLLRAQGLPVEVVVEDLSGVVELGGRAAIVVGLHDDLHTHKLTVVSSDTVYFGWPGSLGNLCMPRTICCPLDSCATLQESIFICLHSHNSGERRLLDVRTPVPAQDKPY